jgi:hypothetical protein
LALVHGDAVRSLVLNPGVILAVLVGLFLLWRRPRLTYPTWLPFAVVAALWCFQLGKYAAGRPL